MSACRTFTPSPEPVSAPLIALYRQYLAETGSESVAATLVLAQVQSGMTPTAGGVQPIAGGLLPLNDAAKYLGYKPSGLRKLVKQGLIRYVQNGRGPIRFRPEWLDDFIASNNPAAVDRSPAQRRKVAAVAPQLANGSQFGFDPRLRRRKSAA